MDAAAPVQDRLLAPQRETNKKKEPTLRDVYPQVVSACLLHSVFMQTGINVAFSATTLPQMLARDSSLLISEAEASWVASLVAIATLVGSLACGPPMDAYGRKACAIATCVPLAGGWLLMAFTPNSVWPVYVARVLTGLGGGMTTVSLVYIGELCHQQYRPMLMCLNSVFVSLGVVVTNLLGVYLHWRTVAFCSGLLSLVTLLGIWIYCPESPQWILNYRPLKFEKAKKALQRLYKNNELFMSEWDQLVASQQARQLKAKELDEDPSCWTKFKTPVNLIPFLVINIIFLFQQISGTYPIFFYAINIFRSIGGDFGTINEYSALILLGASRFIISLLTALASKRIGRRPLMLASGTGMVTCSLIAAVFFQNRSYDGLFHNKMHQNTTGTLPSESLDAFSWIGPVSILLYVCMSSFGFLIIPWSLIAELLPLSIRGVGSGFIICFTHIIMFGVVKCFPLALDILKISGAFYFFCLVSMSGTVFVYYFLPETLGKSHDEIEKHFENLTKSKRKSEEYRETC